MNNIFVISGPSGSGKSTLIRKLLREFRDLNFSVSHTTRKKREGEADSKDYYFVDRTIFSHMIKQHEFAEWAEVHGELYGTSLSEIRKKSMGKDIIALDIDVQGAEIIRTEFPDSIHVFIMPPDLRTLRERLKKREKTLNYDFRKRLSTAVVEMKHAPSYDYVVVNDDLESAYQQLKKIFEEFREGILKRPLSGG